MAALVEFIYDCTACGVEGIHRYDGDEVACTVCGTPREIAPELIASVLGMEFCQWCRENKPAKHTCKTEEPACESPTHLDRCGICPTDLVVQERDLARRADLIEHGTPDDLYTP